MTLVAQIMRRAPTAVSPGTSATEAAALFERESTHYLFVVDRGELVGVLCSCGLIEVGVAVQRYMSRPVLCVPKSTHVAGAAASMRENGFGCLPIVDGGRVVGLVERADFRKAGLPFEAVSCRPPCAACGSDQHVRPWNELEDLGFCFDCRERTGPAAFEEELGGSG